MIAVAELQKANHILQNALRIICVCHRNPDGDAAGALLGLALLVEEGLAGRPAVRLCFDELPATFHFMPGARLVQQEPDLRSGDVIVFVDSAEPKLTGYFESHPDMFRDYPSINIDHHPTNVRFGALNIIEPAASSACEIVLQLAEGLQWPLGPDAATCLLTGVFTDTGGFLHSNTTPDVYRAAARLQRAGARHQEVIRHVFRTAKLSTLRLWGRVLEKISITEEGGAISAVTEGDFRATGADYTELTGAIDYLNAVPGMRFSLILSERGGTVKGSLRTLRDDVDVSAMANKFEGGGHKKAAGFSIPGHLEPEVRWKVVSDQEGGAASAGPF
ncbi:MAG TPA: DHH family phosphoesterase [Candidatus Peribacteraceae bacterium]|nr:DHH family phosphoesterase [Candidatus Peribacteraceae bacterium]